MEHPTSPPALPQVFIVLRKGVRPGWVQLASITSSFLTTTIGPAEEFLANRQSQLCDKNPTVERYTNMTIGNKLPLFGIKI